ncbi:hypothetical protein Aduo_017948 [Ancylostoma duodenale]
MNHGREFDIDPFLSSKTRLMIAVLGLPYSPFNIQGFAVPGGTEGERVKRSGRVVTPPPNDIMASALAAGRMQLPSQLHRIRCYLVFQASSWIPFSALEMQ